MVQRTHCIKKKASIKLHPLFKGRKFPYRHRQVIFSLFLIYSFSTQVFTVECTRRLCENQYHVDCPTYMTNTYSKALRQIKTVVRPLEYVLLSGFH